MWSIDNGRVGKRVALTGHEGPVLAVDVSNDGHWLISASQDMTARMWDLTSPAPWRNAIVLQGHTGPVTKVAISEDSKLAVTASSDNTLRIWELDAKDPAVSGVTFKGHTGVINDLRLDRSGTWAVTAGKDAKVFAWNLAKRDRVVEFVEFPGHTREASSIAISADGRWLISGSIDGNAFVWDYRGGKDSSNGNYFPGRSHDGVINDVDVSRDGRKIYFSDASTRFGVENYMFDLLEARPYGRLLVYDRATGATTVLRDGLYFANGVALSQNEDFVLVNETWRYRIQRCWLPGSPKAGECEVFIDNLPGFPDGVATDGVAADGEGRFFVAIFTVRNPQAEFLQPRPFLKRLLAKLPRSLWPKPAPYGLVLELDETGRIVRSLHDPGGRTVRGLSSVEPHDGALYLGNLDGDWIGRWR
ncbi:MAG: hypothetical protein HC897_14500 [Thermoanaerobaculia bacterium]|nr:hypothetical protein [Thermoanaerobaculia bacterium]